MLKPWYSPTPTAPIKTPLDLAREALERITKRDAQKTLAHQALVALRTALVVAHSRLEDLTGHTDGDDVKPLLAQLIADVEDRDGRIKTLEAEVVALKEERKELQRELEELQEESTERIDAVVRLASDVLGPENAVTEPLTTFRFRRALEDLH